MHSAKGQYAAIGQCKWNKLYEQLPHPSKHFNGQPVEGLCITFFLKTTTTSSIWDQSLELDWKIEMVNTLRSLKTLFLNRKVAFSISANLTRVDH